MKYKVKKKVSKNSSLIFTVVAILIITFILLIACTSGADLPGITQYTLTLTSDINGTTNPTGAMQVGRDFETNIVAIPNETYSFVNWTVTTGTGVTFNNSYSASTTVTLRGGDATIQANFSQNSYQLTVTDDGYGTTTPLGNINVVDGVPTDISAEVTDAGYVFGWWSVEIGEGVEFGDETAAQTTVTLTAGDAEIRANFAIIPIADFEADILTGDDPLVVQFTDLSTGDISSWAWDFGDGSGQSVEQNPSHTYNSPGNYTVGLMVVGPSGTDTEEKVKYINVGGVPVADFSADPKEGDDPLTVQFSDLSTGDIWSWEWDFDNDGTVDSYDQNPQYIYYTSDIYTVSLTVTGPTGSDVEIKWDYIIAGEAPVADFSATPVSGDSPLEVQFTDQSTGDIWSREWDFDDDGAVDSTERDPLYTYNYGGDYTIRLSVTGPAGTDDEVKTDYISSTGWGPVGGVGFSERDTFYTSLSVYNGTPYVAVGFMLTVMKYTGNMTETDGQDNDGWEYVGGAGISDGGTYWISLSVYNGTPYVAYQDVANSDRATVMEYTGNMTETDGQDNDGWEYVGGAGFSDGQAHYTSLSVYNGTPYVAYQDVANSYSATVMKYTGNMTETDGQDNDGWEYVGAAGISDGWAYYTSLSVYNGTPYVAYLDVANSGRAMVMEYTGNMTETDGQDNDGWEYVGGAGISDGGAYYTSLYVYNGTPYVAYQDGANSNRATVMEYTGNMTETDGQNNDGWEYVGAAGFSDGETDCTSLSVYNGTPYVAYRDVANSYRATVMKYHIGN